MAPALHLSVALDGAGWHPAAWREPRARPDELFTARYWTDVIAEAERGLLDFVTIEDALSLQSARFGEPDPRTDQVRGRLDAVLIAARVAPVTRHVGLIPSVVVTHTEPFHVSKAIATLDYVSGGRAGVQVRVSSSPHEAAHFGRRAVPPLNLRDRDDPEVREFVAGLFEEAADYVEVIRRLWDSWEEDAEIRDAATGRFIDRDKLHYIDFAGDYFSVKGPSITPRPPQGQPVVSALGHGPGPSQTGPYRLIGRSADVGFVTPHDAGQAQDIVTEIRSAQAAAGRAEDTVGVLGDLAVFLDQDDGTAAGRKHRLDDLAGQEYRSDTGAGRFAHTDVHFDISGQFSVPRSPQGRPVIFQAGDSADGREFAASSADAIFSRHGTLEDGQAFYADVKGRLAKYGRTAGELLILPAATFVLGDTDADARELAREIRFQQVSGQTAIMFAEQLWNRDLSGYDPDGPLPDVDPDPGENTIARGRASVRMYRDPLAVAAQWRARAAGNLSIRELIIEVTGRQTFVGAPATVAEAINTLVQADASDGFILVPHITPGGLDDFADRVVPLLQERGVFRADYKGSTLREHLGLAPVATPRTAAGAAS